MRRSMPNGRMNAIKDPPADLFPVTNETAKAAYEFMFAPWVRQLGLRDFDVASGRVSALMPEADALKFSAGAVCGQAVMAAIDTVASMAMCSTERLPRGTVYQHTHFLRPAKGGDFRVEATVLRFGKATAYGEGRITLAGSDDVIAHAVFEFAF